MDRSFDRPFVWAHEHFCEIKVVEQRLLRQSLMHTCVVEAAIEKVISAPDSIVLLLSWVLKGGVVIKFKVEDRIRVSQYE